jgi:hypothetical protein
MSVSGGGKRGARRKRIKSARFYAPAEDLDVGIVIGQQIRNSWLAAPKPKAALAAPKPKAKAGRSRDIVSNHQG